MAGWYCKIAGEESGPLAVDQLKTMAAEGQLLPDDLVRQGAAGAWIPAGRVKGLFGPSAPAPASPAAPKRLPKARPVARPVDEPPPPPARASRRAAAVRPPPEGDDAVDDEPPAYSPPAGRKAGSGDEFSFLEDAYSGPPPAAAGTKSATVEAIEKKRKDAKRRQMTLFAVMGGLMVVLAGLMAVIFLSSRDKKHEPVAKAAEPDETKTDEPADPEKTDKKDKKKDGKDPPKEKVDPKDFLDASKRSASLDDIRVSVEEVEIARPTSKNKAQAPTPALIVRLKLANVRKGKLREYQPWTDAKHKGAIKLTDDYGNSYKLAKYEGGAVEGSLLEPASIHPEESIKDVLVFERPVREAQFLYLTLPGTVVESKANAQFEIPRSMIKEDKTERPKGGDKPDAKRSEADRPEPAAALAQAEPAPAATPTVAERPKPAAGDDDDRPTNDPRRDFGIDSDAPDAGRPGPWSTIPPPPIKPALEEMK